MNCFKNPLYFRKTNTVDFYCILIKILLVLTISCIKLKFCIAFLPKLRLS